VLLADLTARDALRNVDQHLGSVGLFNAAPAQLGEVDVELAQLLADVTAASIGGPHRYQQDIGIAVGAQQRLADAAVLEQAKGRLSVQLAAQPDRALATCTGTSLTSGLTQHEAAEQVAVGGLRLQRTAAGTIPQG